MGGYSNTFKKSLRLTSALGLCMSSIALPMMGGNSVPLVVCSGLLAFGTGCNLGYTLRHVLVGRSLSSEQKERIDQAFEDLKTIPFMQPIMQNLPEDINYVIDTNETRRGVCYGGLNTIGINERLLNDTFVQSKLALYKTLAHELAHANQYKEGLFGDYLISPSFGDTVRVDRMLEAEAKLVGVMAENELLKRPEFCGCVHSDACRYYRKELDRAGGDVSKANTAFVLSYWKKSLNNPFLNDCEKGDINRWNFYYTMQGYRHSYFSKSLKKNSSKKARTALEVMGLYAQRMGLTGVDPEQFLEDGFDSMCIGKRKDGIRILNVFGKSDETLVITPVNLSQRYKGRLLVKGEAKAEFSINENAEVRVLEENDTYLKYLAGLVWLLRWLKKKKTAPLEITPDGKVKFPFALKGGWLSNSFEDGKYSINFASTGMGSEHTEIDLIGKVSQFCFKNHKSGWELDLSRLNDGGYRIGLGGPGYGFYCERYTPEEFEKKGISKLKKCIRKVYTSPAKKRQYEDYSLWWLENVRRERG